jgi:hypothetical protein
MNQWVVRSVHNPKDIGYSGLEQMGGVTLIIALISPLYVTPLAR